jgi:hypothetical protein
MTKEDKWGPKEGMGIRFQRLALGLTQGRSRAVAGVQAGIKAGHQHGS